MTDVSLTPYGNIFSASALANDPYEPAASAGSEDNTLITLNNALDTPEGVLPGTGGGSTGTSPTPLQAGSAAGKTLSSFLGFLTTLGGWERVFLVVIGAALVIVALIMMTSKETILGSA